MHTHSLDQSDSVNQLSLRHEKGADTQTLSAEIFENCGNFLVEEDYAPLFSEENFFLVEMFDETFIFDLFIAYKG